MLATLKIILLTTVMLVASCGQKGPLEAPATEQSDIHQRPGLF